MNLGGYDPSHLSSMTAVTPGQQYLAGEYYATSGAQSSPGQTVWESNVWVGVEWWNASGGWIGDYAVSSAAGGSFANGLASANVAGAVAAAPAGAAYADVLTVAFSNGSGPLSISISDPTIQPASSGETFSAASLQTGTGYGGDAQGDTFSNIQNLLGSSYDDELEGLPGSVLNGGPGDDTLDYSGGDNTYIGGGGFDTVDYATAPSAVYVNLASNYGAWAAAGDTYNAISEVIGSPYNDTVYGASTGTTFNGGGGNDTFYGQGGDTYILDQGQGAEYIYDSNSATNTLQLGPGITWDTIYFAAANSASGYLTVGLQGTSSAATVYANFNNGNNNNILKTLDLDGASQLDISRIGYAPGVVNGALTAAPV
jgi:hypothetical protein